MHFDKKSSDFNEENYISWILDEDGSEVQKPTTISVTAVANALAANITNTLKNTINPPAINSQLQSDNAQQLHSCDKCNYSSTYKGNVVSNVISDYKKK